MNHDFVQAVNSASGVGSTVGASEYYVTFKPNGTYDIGWNTSNGQGEIKLKVPQLYPPNLGMQDYQRIRCQFETDFENALRAL